MPPAGWSATRVPAPCRPSSHPSATSWAYAAATVFRASPRSPASDREEGSRVPGGRRPPRSASRSARSSAPRTRPPSTSRCRSTPPMAHDLGIKVDHNRAPRWSSLQAMTTTHTEIPVRLDFDGHAPAFAAAMNRLDGAATKELDRVGFDARLRELVRLRASQLNGCAYCVNMHSADARAAGETDQRLALLAVWPETALFDARRAGCAGPDRDDHARRGDACPGNRMGTGFGALLPGRAGRAGQPDRDDQRLERDRRLDPRLAGGCLTPQVSDTFYGPATIIRLAQRVPRRTLAAGGTPPLSWGVAPTSGRPTFARPFSSAPPRISF